MDLNFIQSLGDKILQQPKFQTLLKTLNLDNTNKQISALTSELGKLEEDINDPIVGLGVDRGDKPEEERLTPQQRKARRQQRKEDKKEQREKKKAELKRKIEIQKQKSIPRFETYTVEGRIFDSQTSLPLQGVDVQIGINSKQLSPEVGSNIGFTPPQELDGVLNLNITDARNFTPYTPLQTLQKTSNVKTDVNGYYSIVFSALVIGEEDESNLGEKRELKSILDLGLVFSKSNYIPTTTSIVTLEDIIKRDINAKGLLNIDVAAENAKNDINNTIYEAQNKLSQSFLDIPDRIVVSRRKSVQNVTNLLTQKLIPLLLSILIAFGIDKVSKKDQAVCPTPQGIKDAIAKRNKAVKQINQVFNTVILNTTLAGVFIVLAGVLKSAITTLDSLAVPTSIGTPPGPAGGVIFSFPYSFIAKLQSSKDLLKELEEQNKKLNKQLLISLAFLIAGLIIARLLLSTIDELTQKCAQDKIDSGELTLEELAPEINQLGVSDVDTNNATTQTQSPFINGFEISVISDDKTTVGTLKRRYAIAKNKQGVILLKGESSFSASDQILIDELKFYIQSNDLKAN